MTSQILTTTSDELFYELVEILSHGYVNPATAARRDRIAKILARREGVSFETIIDAALVELADEAVA